MIAVLYLALSVLACYAIVRRLGSTVFRSGIESLAVSAPLAIALTSMLASAGAVFLAQGTAAWLALGILLIVGIFCWRSSSQAGIELWPAWQPEAGHKLWYIAVLIIVGGFMAFLVINTVRPGADAGSIQIPAKESGDIVYHLSQILRVGGTQDWNFEEPSFADEFIRYPFFINAFSGYLLKFGAPLLVAYHAPMLLLILPLLFGFLLLCRQLGLGKIHTLIVLAATLFGSGLAYAFGYDFNAGSAGVAYPQQYVNFTGLIAGYYVNQRAFALGFALFVFSLIAFFRGLKEDDINGFKWAGFLFGLLPLAHSHTFIVGAIFYGVVFLYYIIRRDRLVYGLVRGVGFYAVFTAIIPVLCMLVLPNQVLGGVPAFRLGWMSDPAGVGGLRLPLPDAPKLGPWLKFALYNFGSLLLFPLVALAGIKKKAGEVFWLIFLSALAMWLVPNLIQFQIWDYDNNKMFVYAVMFSAIAAVLAVKSLSYSIARKIALALLIAATLASLVIPAMKLKYMVAVDFRETLSMFTKEQQDASSWIKANTPETAAFISSAVIPARETLLNPVVIGSSRRATIGYILWLYTHGIDATERLNKVEAFLNDGDRSHLSDIPADYLIADPILRNKYPGLETALAGAGLSPVYEGTGPDHPSHLSIYKLK